MTETLVIGGTGAMGSRVVRRVLDTSDGSVAVLTRNPQSEQARGLVEHGGRRIRLIQGDIDDAPGVRAAMSGVPRVFCNTDFFSSASALREYQQGLAILAAAEDAGVDRFVWSSLDSAVSLTSGRTAVPHFDGKGAVAAHINLMRSEEMMQKTEDGWYSQHASILTTSPYFENLELRLAPRPATLADGREGLRFTLPLGDGKYPLIGLEDIAWFATFMLDNWQSWGSRDLAVAGDSPTGDEIAATFEQVTGIPAGYHSLPLEAVRASIPDLGHDFAAMFQFFQEHDVVARNRDMVGLRAIHPGLMSFRDWLQVTGWSGDEIDVQKFPVRLPS